MSRVLWNALRLSAAAISAAILLSNPAIASEVSESGKVPDQTSGALPDQRANILEQVNQYSQVNPNNLEPTDQAEVTSVSEVSASGAVAPVTPAAQQEQPANILEQLNQYSQVNQDEFPLQVVPSVSNLTDVSPNDWAFSALQSLAERYGCLLGYRDGTYLGNRAITRYEFAAGLNECLNQIQELIEGLTREIGKEDLEKLGRLQEEFAAELATLRGRVDGLEVRTAELQANQFSTTTKLNGEVIFGLSDLFGDRAADLDDNEDNNPDLQNETNFAERARLNFDTSFTGKDRLRTRLQVANFTPFSGNVTGTNMTRLGFDTNSNNDVALGKLFYSFLLSPKVNVIVDAVGGDQSDNVPIFTPLGSGGTGAISRFGRYNPIYRQGDGGAGITFNFNPTKQLGLSLGYLAGPNAARPTSEHGLFDGPYAALAQVSIKPNDNIGLGLTYVNSYYPGDRVNLTGSTGSGFAQRPFGTVATTSNQFALEASVRIAPQFTLAGWAGYATAEARAGEAKGDSASIVNWSVSLAAPDLGKKGNLGAIIIGQPPKVTDNDLRAREDNDTSLHVEVLYRYAVNSNISITPGVLVITNPEHNSNNDTIVVGTLRTTFTF